MYSCKLVQGDERLMIKVETAPSVESLIAEMRQLSEEDSELLRERYCRNASWKPSSKSSTIISVVRDRLLKGQQNCLSLN